MSQSGHFLIVFRDGDFKLAGPDLTAKQQIAVLGLALISIWEDMGSEMCYRSFSHLVSHNVVIESFFWSFSVRVFIEKKILSYRDLASLPNRG